MSDPLRELAKQLPWDRPDSDRREAVRSSLLVAATHAAPPARRRWLLAGGAFAAGALAAAIAIVVLWPSSRSTPAEQPRAAHARVDAPATAKLEHTVTGSDELVRVRAGVVRVAVPPTKSRVRTRTADAEIEGTGAYEVAVVDDRLERVSVSDGSARVTVRIDGKQQQIFLATGQTWRPTIVTAQIELEPPPPPPAPVRTKPRPAPQPEAEPEPEMPRMPAVTSLEPAAPTKPEPSATERHFQRGWTLLREGKPREAAVELGIAADAGGDDPLAADARYFQAIALARANQPAAAERVLAAFLERAPTSLRRGRAAILLGKLLRDRGDRTTAHTWFEVAARDPDPAIAAAARAHLDAR
jgi:TolA-binding protein